MSISDVVNGLGMNAKQIGYRVDSGTVGKQDSDLYNLLVGESSRIANATMQKILASSHVLQVFNPVVISDRVFVIDFFSRRARSKKAVGYQPMNIKGFPFQCDLEVSAAVLPELSNAAISSTNLTRR